MNRKALSRWRGCGACWKQFAKDFYTEVSNHDIFNGAAALAFYLMLSIFPFAIFILSLLPFLPIPHLKQAIMDLLGQALPQESANLFTGVINDVTSLRRGGLLSLGLIFLIWSSSSGLYAVMQQLNIIYDVKEDRPFWKVRGTALLLTVLFFVLIVGAFSLIVFGGFIKDWIGNSLGWSKPLLIFFMIFHWVVILAFLLLAFAIIYYFGPDVKQKFKFITPGGVFGVVLLVLASLAFQIYIAHFANYSATYGSLGAVIILQLWLYICGLVLLAGSEVNVLVEHHKGKSKGHKDL
jgi:membrane protein